MPVRAESKLAIARAKFPERTEPWGGIARSDVRACRDQPTLDDFAQKSLSQQTLAIGARKFFRAEDVPAVPLQLLQLFEGGREFLVEGGHIEPHVSAGCSFKFIVSYIYKYIVSY